MDTQGKGCLLILAGIVALSIAITLLSRWPRAEKAKLDFEREKYEEQREKRKDGKARTKLSAQTRRQWLKRVLMMQMMHIGHT